ncbi:tRNA lysidine(34) synthetase TilS [Halobacillus sp. KGW1]|uniref:tRNA lysidine(34) synthetase TilS n=1 Tax=Halobacillus sp. KGW1 TaxID=1793726 RepID=UPI0007DC1D3A|nr:tRNA lysidine(34) synthetase TilS [Halobacillus sp. KGW1]
MDRNVRAFITKHQLIQPRQVVLAAVSGGPDSLALLHFLNLLREDIPFRLTALSVDHGLRGVQSQEDLLFVERICREWEIEFVGTSVDVQTYKEWTGKGTQEAARDLRYRFFEEMMEAHDADVLATGHHGDDQAETMVMQMVRGARPEALQGMPLERPFSTGRIIRPLLGVSKQDIAAYLDRHGIEAKHDPSNEQTDYTRNAFRKYVLPFMKEQNPKLHEHMQAWSERAREERTYIRKQAEEVLKTVHFSTNVEKFVQLSVRTFKTFPPALQRTAFHLILNYLYVKQTEDISYLHEDLFLDLLKGEKSNVMLDFPGGLKVVRAYDEVTLSFQKKSGSAPYRFQLEPGGHVVTPDGSVVEAEWTETLDTKGHTMYICDTAHVELPLIVRSRKNGDRIRLKGMDGSKKVKDIFIDQKVPAALRDSWPIVTDQTGKIIWVAGLRGSGTPVDPSSGTWLRLHYKNKADT